MTPAIASPLSAISSDNPLVLIFVFMGISLLPMFLLAVSSFVKISVVLNIFRNAIGAGQIPSGPIVGVLSIVLTLHVMMPVVSDISQILQQAMQTAPSSASDKKTDAQKGNGGGYAALLAYFDVAKRSSQPLQLFLRKHAHLKERGFFADYQRYAEEAKASSDDTLDRVGAASSSAIVAVDLPLCVDLAIGGERTGPNCTFKGETVVTLASAFLISELKQAFLIGFAIYLPFLVLDLVVANILVGMGMSMVNPVTIALPFKLILFVMTDGWFLLSRGLVLSYR